jgi:hypothetical protein
MPRLPDPVHHCCSEARSSSTGVAKPSGTLYLFSGISYEKNIHKDPGKCWQCAGSAGIYMHVLVPIPYRTIAKRHAMTGSGLDCYAVTLPAPWFQRGRKKK